MPNKKKVRCHGCGKVFDTEAESIMVPCPECGMFSTAADVLAFHQMMLNGGTYNGRRLLSRQSVRAMTMLHTGDLKAEYVPFGPRSPPTDAAT